MKTISVRDLRQRWPEAEARLQVEKEIVITRDAKPVAKLVPIQTDSAKLIGSFKGRIKIKGNILSTGVKWDAES